MELSVRFAESQIDKCLLAPGQNMGDYFEKFCSEAFAKRFANAQYDSGRGVDGAIDGSFTDDDGIAFWEAKYFGTEVAIEVKEIVQKWGMVKKTLITNLKPNAPARSQYQRWYSETDVKSYYFCVSGRFANGAQRERLRSNIENFLRELSEREGLEHLAQLKARVWSWDDFETTLNRYPGLSQRWFLNQRPIGWIPLDSFVSQPASSAPSFQAFLLEAVLPYFSLASYKLQNPSSAILDEEAWLDQFEKDDAIGFIVTGAGGIGKTRLMYELGQRAHQRGWITLVAGQPDLETDGVVAQVSRAATDDTARWLLLIDYAETRRDLAKLWNAVSELNRIGRVVRVLATSRSTSEKRLKDVLENARWIRMSPSSNEEREWLAQYRRAVISHILRGTQREFSEEQIGEFAEMPVLAAFAFYLAKFGCGTNLDDLLGEVRFESYLRKRVGISLPGVDEAIKKVASLMPQLPWDDSSADKLDGELSTVRKALYGDRWIDRQESDKQWRVAHDIFADTLLQSYLNEVFETRPHDLTREVKALFTLARKLGTTTSCLTSIERLRVTRWISGVNWDEFFSQQITDHGREWGGSRVAILQYSLLTAREKLSHIRISAEFWKDVEHEVGYEQAIISISAEYRAHHEKRPEDLKTLTDLFVRGINSQSSDNKLVTVALRELPPASAADPLLLQRIKRDSETLQNDFPLVAWLRSGRPSSAVEPYVKEWLSAFSSIYTASYLLSAWLKAGENPEGEKPLAVGWMQTHGSKDRAVFVLTAWIRRFKDTRTFNSRTIEWLNDKCQDEAASFVYTAWLNAKGDKALVQDPIRLWLGKHQEEEVAHRIYTAWLNAKGDKALVQEPMRVWLAKHQESEVARFLYTAWLSQDGDLEDIIERLTAWLRIHGLSGSADYVYSRLFASDSGRALTEPYIGEWFSKHEYGVDAGYAISAWLKHSGKLEFATSSVQRWLRQHAAEEPEQAWLILKDWRENGGAPDAVAVELISWLRSNYRSIHAARLLDGWIAAGGDKGLVGEIEETIRRTETEIQESITQIRIRCQNTPLSDEDFSWIAEQSTRIDVQSSPDVLFCFPKFNADTFRTPGGQKMLGALIDAITYHSKSLYIDSQGRGRTLTRLIAFLFDCFHPPMQTPFSLKNALTMWIRHAQSFSETKPSDKPPLDRLLDEIAFQIATGELDEDADATQLKRVFEWTARCRPDKIDVVRTVLGRYETQHPGKSKLWKSWRQTLDGASDTSRMLP